MEGGIYTDIPPPVATPLETVESTFLCGIQVSAKNEWIRRLQADIGQVQRAADDTLRRTRADAAKQQAAECKNSDGKLVNVELELTQVRAEYADVLARHRDGEQALRKVSDHPIPPPSSTLSSDRQYLSYTVCLEVRGEILSLIHI